MPLVMPQQQILLSLADPFTVPDYTDITPLAQVWGGKTRGRQHELQRFEAGQVNLTLNNQDGRFNRWSTKSPYYNLLSEEDAACDNLSPQPQPEPVGSFQSLSATGASTFDLTVVADGDAVFLVIDYQDSSLEVSSLSGGGVGSWSKLQDVTDSTDNQRFSIWMGTVVLPGTWTVTITWSGSASGVGMEFNAQEFSGRGPQTVWTYQTGSASSRETGDLLSFPDLSSSTAAMYFGYAWCSNDYLPAASDQGFAYMATIYNNLVVYNPALLSDQTVTTGAYLSSSAPWIAAGVMVSVACYTWAAAGDCTLSVVQPPVALNTSYATALTATGSGTMEAITGYGEGGVGANAGTTYTAMASFLSAADARSCTVNVAFYDATGSSLGAYASSAVTDSTTAWTKATVTATAPANTAYAAVYVTVESVAGSGEVHYICRAGLFQATALVPSTAWAPGRRSLVPARTIQINATWDDTSYAQFTGRVNSWLPAYKKVRSTLTVQVTDDMKLIAAANMDSSIYASQVLSDGATGFWRCADSSGTTVFHDSGASGYNATIHGSPTFGEPGPLATDSSTAAGFATSAAGELPSGAGVSGTSYSIEALIQVATTGVSGWVYAARDSGLDADNAVFFGLETGYLTASFYSSSGTSTGLIQPAVDLGDGDWHHIVVTRSGTVVRLYDNGVQVGSDTLTTNPSTPNTNAWFGGDPNNSTYITANMGDVAVYQGVTLSAEQVLNHYQLAQAGALDNVSSGTAIQCVLENGGWPSDLLDIATGLSTVTSPSYGSSSSDLGTASSTTSLLSYCQAVEATEFGALYVLADGTIVFRDRLYEYTNSTSNTSQATLASDNDSDHYQIVVGSIVPASDDLDSWNDVTVQNQVSGSLPQNAQNAASIQRYGRRSLQGYTSSLGTSDAFAAAQANWLCNAYAPPRVRARQVTLSSVANDGKNLPIMLGLDVLDRITLIWTPPDQGGTLTQDYWIEAISHSVTQGEWQTTWTLAYPYPQPTW